MMKKSTHRALYKSTFLSEVLSECDDDVHIYTDDSRQDEIDACSYSVYGRCMYSLRFYSSSRLLLTLWELKVTHVSYNDFSIFTTEVEVIHRAIILIKMKIYKK